MPTRKGIKPVSYEDTSFVVGDSPVTHDINADLGLNSACGYIICDGAGDILINISTDGSTWGGQFTMKSGEKFDLDTLDVDSIKVTHKNDSAYRILAW